jgi:hypothetical protein
MRAIFYIWRKTLINNIKDLKHHPTRLIAILLVAAFLVFAFVSLSGEPLSQEEISDALSLDVLGMILFALFAFIFVSEIFKGLDSGASFFGMQDVNFLFVAPLNAKHILAYGLIRQTGTALLMSLFLLFQVGTVRSLFALDSSAVWFLFLGYALTVLIGELFALVIYSFSNGNPQRKKLIKSLVYGLLGLLGVGLLVQYLRLGSMMEALSSTLNSRVLEFIPGPGFAKGLVFAILTKDYWALLYLAALTILLVTALVTHIARMDTDYYEDVLQAAEQGFATREAAQKGRMSENTGHVKVKKQGIGRGQGASAFFFKHMLENRRSGILLIDRSSIGTIVGTVIVVLALRENISGDMGMIAAFAFMTYMQLFFTMTGRLAKELPLPYIYLIPQGPLKKLLFCSFETILKAFIEGILLLLTLGILLKASPLLTLILLLARVSYACYFLSGNMLMERLLGSLSSKGLMVTLYFLLMILLLLPGVGAAFAAYFLLAPSLVLSIVVLAAYNMLVSLILLVVCKDLLHNMELNV